MQMPESRQYEIQLPVVLLCYGSGRDGGGGAARLLLNATRAKWCFAAPQRRAEGAGACFLAKLT